jgi:hypothetical protein
LVSDDGVAEPTVAREDGAISHEHARRELVALSRVGLLRRVGAGRRTSYVRA